MKVLNKFKARALESLLIIVAVAVAVTAVSAVANIAELIRRSTLEFSNSLYARQIILKPKADDYDAFYQGIIPVDIREMGPDGVVPPQLKPSDLEAVKANVPSVEYAYLADYTSFSYQAEGRSDYLDISKITVEYQDAAKLLASEGSLLSTSDFREHNQVILLTPLGVKRLNLKAPIVGQKVTFDNNKGTYTVVGVVKQDETQDSFYHAFIPWTPTAGSSIEQLNFTVASAAVLPQTQSEIRAYAEKTWGNMMVVRSNMDGNQVFLTQQRTRASITAVFASLVLVTAALSIMALMLARVLRQKREIGIHRCLGATRGTVRHKFLREALMLGATGGFIGVAVGYGLFIFYGRYMESFYEGYSRYFTFSWFSAGISFGIALLVSLLFGLYPAILASKVYIVDALKEA